MSSQQQNPGSLDDENNQPSSLADPTVNDENEEIVAQVSSLINNLDINQQSQLMN